MDKFDKPSQAEFKALATTSDKIRYLHDKGFTNTQVVDLLKRLKVTTKAGGEIRYQFVRNVINNPRPTAKVVSQVTIEK